MSVMAQRVLRRVAVLVTMMVMPATVVGCDVESGRLAGSGDALTTLPLQHRHGLNCASCRKPPSISRMMKVTKLSGSLYFLHQAPHSVVTVPRPR